MSFKKRAELARIAVELVGLKQAAMSAGEPFLAHLINMAMIEAHTLRGGTIEELAAEVGEAVEIPVQTGTRKASVPELAGC